MAQRICDSELLLPALVLLSGLDRATTYSLEEALCDYEQNVRSYVIYQVS